MSVVTVIRRAFGSNLQTVTASESERAALVASGIEQPTMQSYFAWRRSLMVFVVAATALGAALATYRDLTETNERLDILKTMSKQLPPGAQIVLPAVLDATGVADAIPEKEDDAEEGPVEVARQAAKKLAEQVSGPLAEAAEAMEEADEAVDKLAEKAGGVADALKAKVTDKIAEQKGSLASPGTAKTEEPADEEERETAFSMLTDVIHLLSYYALPVAALLVVWQWTRFKFSFQIIVAAFAFSFLFPFLIALCPWSWWGYEEPNMIKELMDGATCLATLLPAILSLVPGVQKACLRVKTLLPQSILPGWFLVAASPFYAMFLLVIFVAVNQFVGDLMFLGGALLLLAAPLVYAVKADIFTSPLHTAEDYARMQRVQKIVGALTAVAGGLIVTFLVTQDVMGIRLFGLDPKTTLLQPLDLVEFFLETMGRAMFMTVLGADVFMRMNVAAWQKMKDFEGSPEAAEYDRIMSEMERVS